MNKYVNGKLTKLTPTEVEQLMSQKEDYDSGSAERISKEVRNQRDRLLTDTDWMALSDNTMSPEWASYRQGLRDITDQAGFPSSVTWPTEPE